jgi:HTH-type transcriptional repressor of NAD biosynthesis genes
VAACGSPLSPAGVLGPQLAVIRASLDRDGRPPVDAVLTSEDYGHELAGWLDASHVTVDPGRRAVPISGSELRADLAGRRTRCVTEAGRDYTVVKWQQARAATAAAAGRPGPRLDEVEWTTEDFDAVAAEQTARENQAAAGGSPLVVCDTDAFAASVWERRYLGEQARGLQPWATALLPPRDVYLLTSHEGVPWKDDGLREGDLAIRAAMTGWFAAALTAAGHSWVLLTGSLEDRRALAVRVTDYGLANRGRFGPAITDIPGTSVAAR